MNATQRVSTIRLLAWLQRVFLRSRDYVETNSIISSIITNETTIGVDLYNRLLKYYNENSTKEEHSFLNTTGNVVCIKDVVDDVVNTMMLGSVLIITVNVSHGDHIDNIPVLLLSDA